MSNTTETIIENIRTQLESAKDEIREEVLGELIERLRSGPTTRTVAVEDVKEEPQQRSVYSFSSKEGQELRKSIEETLDAYPGAGTSALVHHCKQLFDLKQKNRSIEVALYSGRGLGFWKTVKGDSGRNYWYPKNHRV